VISINVWGGDGIEPPHLVQARKKREREQALARERRSARMRRRREEKRDRATKRRMDDIVDMRARTDQWEAYNRVIVVGCERHDFERLDDGFVRIYAQLCEVNIADDLPISVGGIILRTPGPGNDKPMRMPIYNAFIGCAITKAKADYVGDDRYGIELILHYREHLGGSTARTLFEETAPWLLTTSP